VIINFPFFPEAMILPPCFDRGPAFFFLAPLLATAAPRRLESPAVIREFLNRPTDLRILGGELSYPLHDVSQRAVPASDLGSEDLPCLLNPFRFAPVPSTRSPGGSRNSAGPCAPHHGCPCEWKRCHAMSGDPGQSGKGASRKWVAPRFTQSEFRIDRQPSRQAF